MKRHVITDANELKAQALDEDVYRLSNNELEVILNYDSLFELALQITSLIKEADESPQKFEELTSELATSRTCLH